MRPETILAAIEHRQRDIADEAIATSDDAATLRAKGVYAGLDEARGIIISLLEDADAREREGR